MLVLSSLFIRRTHYRTYNNIQPITVLEYPDQASKIIWSVTPKNISISSSQIKNLIKTNKISVDMAFRLIDIASQIRVKDIKLFTDFYQQLSNEFSYTPSPQCKRLATLLYYRGFRFPYFYPSMKEEEVLNIYPTDSPIYYIAWDKVDDLQSKFPDLLVNYAIDDLFPLDCAIQYGSELCFNYLYNKGAHYDSDSEEYAVKGGNINIFIQMVKHGRKFDKLINIALAYHNFDIANYLKWYFGQTPDSVADCFYYGNFDIASSLLSSGADINDRHQEGYWWKEKETTPLIFAIQTNSIDIIKFLVQYGANASLVTRWDESSWTIVECPLSFAIKKNSSEITNFLIEYGADVNVNLVSNDDTEPQVPLHSITSPLFDAINVKSLEIVDSLVQHGADVNMLLDYYSYRAAIRPLTLAKKLKLDEIIKYLIDHGATE